MYSKYINAQDSKVMIYLVVVSISVVCQILLFVQRHQSCVLCRHSLKQCKFAQQVQLFGASNLKKGGYNVRHSFCCKLQVAILQTTQRYTSGSQLLLLSLLSQKLPGNLFTALRSTLDVSLCCQSEDKFTVFCPEFICLFVCLFVSGCTSCMYVHVQQIQSCFPNSKYKQDFRKCAHRNLEYVICAQGKKIIN